MIRCERCGAEWNPPKKSSKSQTECPYCGAVLLEETKARSCGKVEEFLGYMVKVYGAEIYRNPERLKNLLGDLYGGEEREKKLYRRVLMEEKLSEKVYEIARKPKAERQAYYNREASQFAEGNYYPVEVGRRVVGSLVRGLTGEVLWAVEAAPQPESKNRTIRVGEVEFEMVYVQGGTFRMGATAEQGEDAWDRENPVHSVNLSDFHIGKHEVTQGLWREVMGENPSDNKAGDNYPVENVSWEDCQRFLERLNNRTGLNFRLPTEAEWEYAARGGTSTPYFFEGNPKKFSNEGFWNGLFGADTAVINSYVVYVNNSKNRTQEPAKMKANPFGLKNMLGNVMEYCSDWYAEDAYSQLQDGATDPKGPASGEEHVVRGGLYNEDAAEMRCAARAHTEHDAWLKTDPQNPKSIWWYSDIKGIGFRVVCEVPEGVSAQ